MKYHTIICTLIVVIVLYWTLTFLDKAATYGLHLWGLK